MRLNWVYTIVFILIVAMPFSYAIKGSIGNARAVVNVDLVDGKSVIDRTVFIQNINNETINVEITTDSNFDLEMPNKVFSLAPDESRKVPYRVTVTQPGTHEIRINVKFKPLDSGNGVILSSVLMVNAEGEGSPITIEEETPEETVDEVVDEEPVEDENEETEDSDSVGVSVGSKKEIKPKMSISDIVSKPYFVTFALLVIVVIILGIFVYKRGRSNKK